MRFYVHLASDNSCYAGQPSTGFTSAANAHDFMTRRSMLAPDRYYVRAGAP